mgnify:CR=1 FL=1
MKHTEIPQDKKEQLEQIIIGLETGKYDDVAEARHNFREILADLALQGHYAGEYWKRYKKIVQGVSAGVLAGLSLFVSAYAQEKPKVELICQPSIYKNDLIVTQYMVREQDGRKFLIKIDEKIVKKNATAEDVRDYKGCVANEAR